MQLARPARTRNYPSPDGVSGSRGAISVQVTRSSRGQTPCSVAERVCRACSIVEFSRRAGEMATVTEARRRRRRDIEVEGFGGASEERSALDQYLREVSRHELLTPQQEIELGHRALRGDEQAVQALV